MEVPILELGRWTRRLAETHVALGRAKQQQVEEWGEAYLDSQEPSATGARNHADALTRTIRGVVAKLEHDVEMQGAVVDFLRRVTAWDSLPADDFLPFPRNE